MICAVHQKEMRQNKKGLYCPTPVEKDGDTVVKWCTWQPTDLAQSTSVSPSEPSKQAVEDKPDWDAISRGKVRNAVAVATIGTVGALVPLTDEIKTLMEEWVTWIMEGK